MYKYNFRNQFYKKSGYKRYKYIMEMNTSSTSKGSRRKRNDPNRLRFVGMTFIIEDHILMVKEPSYHFKTSTDREGYAWGPPGGGPDKTIFLDKEMTAEDLKNDPSLLNTLVNSAIREFYEETMGIFGTIKQLQELFDRKANEGKILIVIKHPNYICFYLELTKQDLQFPMEYYNIIFSNVRSFTIFSLTDAAKVECLEIHELDFVPFVRIKDDVMRLRITFDMTMMEKIGEWLENIQLV